MTAHPWLTPNGLYISPEGKSKLYRIAQTMAEGALKELKATMTPDELEEFYNYCDAFLKSGAFGLKYALDQTFIPAALGLDPA